MASADAPEFSVVVPTHNRIDVLPEVLAALETQEAAPSFELLVVDDGSSDATAQWLKAWQPAVPATVLHQPNKGPAAARNLAIRHARGRWVALLGDDTVPRPDWLARHRAAHALRGDPAELAVIGYTRWHPRMHTTKFLEYINEWGLQFGYALISDPERVAFNFLYTSNLSLQRDRLREEPFHEGFPYPAWEDIETSYRLFARGLRLVYETQAVTWHDHPTDLRRFFERQERAGYSGVVFHGLHPELGPFVGMGPDGPPPQPPAWRTRALEALARALQPLPIRTPRLWNEVLRHHYIRGLRRGFREKRRGGSS